MKNPTAPVALVLLVLVTLGVVTPPALAQTRPPSLSQLSIEDLMNIEITSASRKEERAADVAAAVFVITHDDILRSGMTTIPDVLRLAPGVQVAQINANKWAVSVRGFNGLYSNKLLVLVDGRSVYNRLFSGVIWQGEELVLDDVERIEVIRGPGAAMWGANAVNGVINIVTKSTAETQGGLVRVEAGGSGTQGVARYGGTAGAARYRLYAQWTGRDESLIAPGTPADDASHSITTGFRTDWTTKPGQLSLDGAFMASRERALWLNLDPQTAAGEPISRTASESQSGHLLGRWTRTNANGASLQVQSFLDIADRREPIGNYRRTSFGAETQYHTALGTHHDLVAGAGYRFTNETLGGHAGITLTPPDASSLVTGFLQDEIALFGERLAVTLGTQVQYDSDSGAGIQPTARVMWKVRPRQRLWAAVSRALRTPSLTDRWIRVDYPPVPTESGLPLVVTILGNPAAETESLLDVEAGYRIEIATRASLDITGFVGRYDHLQTQEVGAPVVQFVPSPQIAVVTQFGNKLEATTRGLEFAWHWRPLASWRLDGSYSAFDVTPHLAASSQDIDAAREDGSAPQQQWQVRSAFTPHPRALFDVAVFHVSELVELDIPAYTRVDATAEWRFTSRLSAMAIGQNLFDEAHTEFGGAATLVQPTQMPRSVSVRLRWTFK